MSESSSLSSILDDEAPAKEPAAPAPETQAPAEAKEAADTSGSSKRKEWREKELDLQADGMGMARDPVTGQFVKKEEAPKAAEAPKTEAPKAEPAAPAAPTQPEMTEREKAFQKALLDERRKRQELEQRLSAPQTKPEEQKPFWDDPEGALKRSEEVARQERTHAKLETAELIARSRHADFDEKVAEFAELVKSTPGLAQQWLAAGDPAEFAYVTGKNHMMLKQVGSLDALTEKVRQETAAKVRAEVEAEYKAKAEAAARERAALPPSLTDTRGASAGAKPVWNGPTPLGDILK